MLTVLREVRSLDTSLRSASLRAKVQLPDSKALPGRNPAAEELQAEFNKWFHHANDIEQKLAASKETGTKSSRATAIEAQVEQKTQLLAKLDAQYKEHITKSHKFDGAWQTLKFELQNLRREKAEIAEKNQQMAKESLPVLEKMKALLAKSIEATDRLTQDAALLSETFRLQVKDNTSITDERSQISRDISRMLAQLEEEKVMRAT